jgi:hypothetical protein
MDTRTLSRTQDCGQVPIFSVIGDCARLELIAWLKAASAQARNKGFDVSAEGLAIFLRLAGKHGLERVVFECGIPLPNASVRLVLRSFAQITKRQIHAYAIFFHELGWTAPTVLPQTLASLRGGDLTLKEMLVVARSSLAEEITLQSHLLDPLWKLLVGKAIGRGMMDLMQMPSLDSILDPIGENATVDCAPFSLDPSTGDPMIFWIVVCPFKARDLRPVTLRPWASGWVGKCGLFPLSAHDGNFQPVGGTQDPHRFEVRTMLSCLGYIVRPAHSLWVYMNTGRGFFTGRPVIAEALQFCRNHHMPYPVCRGDMCDGIPSGRVIDTSGGTLCRMKDTSIHCFESIDTLLSYYAPSMTHVDFQGDRVPVDTLLFAISKMRNNPLMYLKLVDNQTNTALRSVAVLGGTTGVPQKRICAICGAGGLGYAA